MKMFKTTFVLFGVVILALMFFWRCQVEDDNSYPDIINSTEFEEYIIASANLQIVHKLFEKAISQVDFSNLETVIDEDSKEIRYLPASVRALNIEEKAAIVVEKKKLLLNKYPNFSSLSLKEISLYTERCVKSSTKVNNFFLENGINSHLPSLRYSPNETYNYNSMTELAGALYNWAVSSDFVEVYVFIFTDNTATVYRDVRNDPYNCYGNVKTIGNKLL